MANSVGEREAVVLSVPTVVSRSSSGFGNCRHPIKGKHDYLP